MGNRAPRHTGADRSARHAQEARCRASVSSRRAGGAVPAARLATVEPLPRGRRRRRASTPPREQLPARRPLRARRARAEPQPAEPAAAGSHRAQRSARCCGDAAAPDRSRRFMFDCGNGLIFMVRIGPAKRRCSRRKRSAAKPSRCRRSRRRRARVTPKAASATRATAASRRSSSRPALRRLHVEPRRRANGRGAAPRRDVPRARQRAVVAARDLARPHRARDGARHAPRRLPYREPTVAARGRRIARSWERKSSSPSSTRCHATTR